MEDTPCLLKRVVIVAYETMYQKTPDAAKRIHLEEVFAKQKALILVGETLLLSTIKFDFNIQHPYEPLKLALKKLGIAQKELRQSAMSLINDTLPTTLVVQFKPHYIAAGSLCLAAKFHNIDLSQNGIIWWQLFDVARDPLKVVVEQMYLLFKKRAPCSMGPVIKPVSTPSAMDKHQIKPISTPIPPLVDKLQSKLAPTLVDKQHMKPTPTPTNKQQIKLAAAPVRTDRWQIVSTPVPAQRDAQSSRRSFSNSNTETSRCVTTSSSFNKKPTGRSPRNEGNWYRVKNEENQGNWCRVKNEDNQGNWCRVKNEEKQYCRGHIYHNNNLEQRLEERSNKRTLKSDLAYLACSGPKDTNATEIRNLTRQKRRIQEVGGLPTPVYMSDANAWRQVSGVIVFETTSSRQKQKVQRR